jgi:hypothetical protein
VLSGWRLISHGAPVKERRMRLPSRGPVQAPAPPDGCNPCQKLSVIIHIQGEKTQRSKRYVCSDKDVQEVNLGGLSKTTPCHKHRVNLRPAHQHRMAIVCAMVSQYDPCVSVTVFKAVWSLTRALCEKNHPDVQ